MRTFQYLNLTDDLVYVDLEHLLFWLIKMRYNKACLSYFKCGTEGRTHSLPVPYYILNTVQSLGGCYCIGGISDIPL